MHAVPHVLHIHNTPAQKVHTKQGTKYKRQLRGAVRYFATLAAGADQGVATIAKYTGYCSSTIMGCAWQR